MVHTWQLQYFFFIILGMWTHAIKRESPFHIRYHLIQNYERSHSDLAVLKTNKPHKTRVLAFHLLVSFKEDQSLEHMQLLKFIFRIGQSMSVNTVYNCTCSWISQAGKERNLHAWFWLTNSNCAESNIIYQKNMSFHSQLVWNTCTSINILELRLSLILAHTKSKNYINMALRQFICL